MVEELRASEPVRFPKPDNGVILEDSREEEMTISKASPEYERKISDLGEDPLNLEIERSADAKPVPDSVEKPI